MIIHYLLYQGCERVIMLESNTNYSAIKIFSSHNVFPSCKCRYF